MCKKICIIVLLLIVFSLFVSYYSDFGKKIDITGTWLLYSGGKVAPDMLEFYSDGTGVTADLVDESYYNEEYISSNMFKNYKRIKWSLTLDESNNITLSIESTEETDIFQLSFEKDIYPNYSLVLCLNRWGGGGGWVPVTWRN